MHIWSQGGEDPLQKEMATHSCSLVGYSPWGRKESDTIKATKKQQHLVSTKKIEDWYPKFPLK